MHANNRLDTIPWQHATTSTTFHKHELCFSPSRFGRSNQRNLIRNSMTLESQSTLLKIIASNSATATPSSTSITRVINLPLLSKADLSSAFCIHDSQQDFWLTKCFWSKYCSAATWNKTLIPIRPSSFPGGVSLTSSEYCPIALPKFFIHHPKYPNHILPSCHEEAQMQPSSDLHTPCAHQHANSIATPVTLDHLICWTCSAEPWEVAACLAWFAKASSRGQHSLSMHSQSNPIGVCDQLRQGSVEAGWYEHLTS